MALSTGESELYATLKASAETLGIISVMVDFGMVMAGEIWGDAQAALGIINRNGFGKTRHIQIVLLWIQQVSAQRRLSFGKVLGKENPADLFAKHFNSQTIGQHLQRLCCEFAGGRADEAPELHSVSMSLDECNMTGEMRQCKWVDVIICVIENKSAKAQKFGCEDVCRGELNVTHEHTHNRQVHGGRCSGGPSSECWGPTA